MRRIKNLSAGILLLVVVMLYDLNLRRRPVATKRKLWHWWVIAALLIIVGNLLQGCRYTPVVTVDLGPYLGGRMVCDQHNRPVVVYHSNLADHPVYRKYTIFHERVHVEQAHRTVGGCQELARRYLADSVFRLAIEGEAYCRTEHQMYMDHALTPIDWLWVKNSMSRYGSEADIPCNESGVPKDGTYTKPP